MIDKIELNIKLRPTNFAFLVRPGNKEALAKIFTINTCLWGGRFNPIIPYITKIPKWWSFDQFGPESPKEVMEGYLRFFKPDFIVETEKGLANKLGVSDRFVLWIDDILCPSEKSVGREGYGLNTFELYKSLYHEELKFERKNVIPTYIVHANDKNLSLFSAAIFGSFPNDKALEYIEHRFNEVFNPGIKELTPGLLFDSYEGKLTFPLQIGSAKLRAKNHNNQWRPTIFIVDITKPNDLIDLWNLRIFRKHVIMIPSQWVTQCSEQIKKIIIDNYKPLPNNQNGLMIFTNIMFGRSFGKEEIDRIIATVKTEVSDHTTFQLFYPEIWGYSRHEGRNDSPAEVELKTVKVEAKVLERENQTFQFNTIFPDFAEQYAQESYRWANEIRFTNSINALYPEVIPDNIKYDKFPSYVNGEVVRSTEKGLVVFPKFADIPQIMNFLTGSDLFAEWLKSFRDQLYSSRPGRILTQMLNTLNGTWFVRLIQNEAIIDKLNLMTINGIRDGGEETTLNTWRGLVGKAKIILGEDYKEYHLRSLCDQNVLKLGIGVQCTRCEENNWIALDNINYRLTCLHCFADFNFPVESPTKTQWTYRSQGPFTVRKYAEGSYTSVLAINFFKNGLRFNDSNITWSANLAYKVLGKNGGEVELFDFAIWYQSKYSTNHKAHLIFGESKSKGKDCFKAKDINNLKKLAQEFPGSVIVFATLKHSLDSKEKKIIKKLVDWAREYDSKRQSLRAYVIVLTGLELFSKNQLQLTWKQKGDKHADLAALYSYGEDDLEQLANWTQQLYLDMECHYKSLMQKRNVDKK